MADPYFSPSYSPTSPFDEDVPGYVTVFSRHTRGVRWVLEWAAALAVLAIVSVTLLDYGHELAAERALSRAAAAGLRAAMLPRATDETVAWAVRSQLAGDRGIALGTKLTFERNGALVSGLVRKTSGDRLSISLASPTAAALPSWLRALSPWKQHDTIAVRLDHRVGGQPLEPRG
jgi:hypothetical protein